MNTAVENMKAANERVLETVKTAQTQMVEVNERASELVESMRPERTPFDWTVANEMVTGYFDFVGEIVAAQRDFTSQLLNVWIADAPKATKAKAGAKS